METSKKTGEERKMEKGRVETMEGLKLKMEAEVEWVQV